ncbi:MAG: 37S ribosomal protein S28, mitochondrial [Paramarteilia canceri]
MPISLSFASLLRRRSPLLLDFGLQPRINANRTHSGGIGQLAGVRVKAIVKRIVPESGDLQLDFGGKFDAFISKSQVKPKDFQYRVGDQVIAVVRDLEVSSSFIGSPVHLSLREADAIVLGLDKDSI